VARGEFGYPSTPPIWLSISAGALSHFVAELNRRATYDPAFVTGGGFLGFSSDRWPWAILGVAFRAKASPILLGRFLVRGTIVFDR